MSMGWPRRCFPTTSSDPVFCFPARPTRRTWMRHLGHQLLGYDGHLKSQGATPQESRDIPLWQAPAAWFFDPLLFLSHSKLLPGLSSCHRPPRLLSFAKFPETTDAELFIANDNETNSTTGEHVLWESSAAPLLSSLSHLPYVSLSASGLAHLKKAHCPLQPRDDLVGVNCLDIPSLCAGLFAAESTATRRDGRS